MFQFDIIRDRTQKCTSLSIYCGKCDTCQIKTQLDKVKPLLLNTNHLQLIKFLFKLIKIIKTQTKILEYLNSLLRPVIDSKDLTYSRNSKIVPSYDRDYLRIIKDADNTYISTFDTEIYNCTNWYLNSNTHVKLNFLINLFKKCDHSVIYMCYLQINRVLEKSKRQNQEFYFDIIKLLPIYLSKKILFYLDEDSLFNCSQVSSFWHNLVIEIRKDYSSLHTIQDELMILKGIKSKIPNPRYVDHIEVPVPNVDLNTFEVFLSNRKSYESNICSKWHDALIEYSNRLVIMEERNVFCGPFNFSVLQEKHDPRRVIQFNGSYLTLGSFDGKIQLINLISNYDKDLTIQAHAASIKCVCSTLDDSCILTGSYDTSIRYWNIKTRKCIKIFIGHSKTVNCLATSDNKFISGSNDNTCRVWSLTDSKNFVEFKHDYPILSVAIYEDTCVSGGLNGEIRVYNHKRQFTLKSIQAHKGIVSGIKLDKWHIVTCGTDGYALAYSTQGKHDKCLIAMRHPKAVTCIEYQYLRVITGSSDGKIRIWNILNGDCLRVMRGNSQCDPINSLSIYDNKILINTEFNLLLMEFEKIKYEYGSKRELEMENQDLDKNHKARVSSSDKLKRPYSQIRANRMRIFNRLQLRSLSKVSLGRSVNSYKFLESTKESLKNSFDLLYVESENEDIFKSSYKVLSEMNLNSTKAFLRRQLKVIKKNELYEQPIDYKHELSETRSLISHDTYEDKSECYRPFSLPENVKEESKITSHIAKTQEWIVPKIKEEKNQILKNSKYLNKKESKSYMNGLNESIQVTTTSRHLKNIKF